MNPNIIALAIPCADDAFRSDIELHCAYVAAEGQPGQPGYRHWYDTSRIDSVCPTEDIATALQYLELRGLVYHHPQAPHVVTFKRGAHG